MYVTVMVGVAVLPPVLVPRYSEYPSQFRHNAVDSSAGLYQPVSEPILPYNASYPYGFRDQQPSSGFSSPASACSLPGITIIMCVVFNLRRKFNKIGRICQDSRCSLAPFLVPF